MHNKENPYALVSKECLDDNRLSWRARGLLAYLLGKPDTWEVISEHLKKQASDGARSLRSGLFELQFFGYLEKFVEKDKGKFKQFGYNIYEFSKKPDFTVLEYENLKKKRSEDEKKRKISRNHPFLRFAQMENSTLVSNDIVSNELILPICESCLDNKEKEMCEKCEQTKRRIEIDEQYGFETDKKLAKKYLAELEMKHNFQSENQDLPKETVEERVLQMLSGHDEYAEKASGFPETVQKSVKLFAETFKLSPSAIPKKSKGKGGLYATWIKGVQDLQSIAGNEKRFKLVLDKTYELWNNKSDEYKNHIDKPQGIRGMFVTMESNLTQEEEKQKEELAEKIKISKVEKEVYITDNEETRKQAVVELKKQMRSMK